MTTRRDFLFGVTGAAVLGRVVPALASARAAEAQTPATMPVKMARAPFKLPDLPYATGALEPSIDVKTMELHHGKHHKAYVEKLNAALEKAGAGGNQTIDKLLSGLSSLPEEIRADVRNNGGGHANHAMFWTIMSPKGGGEPKGDLARALNAAFGSFSGFKEKFEAAGNKHFGSGWVFVVMGPGGKDLQILTRSNQDSPLVEARPVLMGNDLWEHAYYLKYNNRKADYLKAWWDVVNWEEIARRYDAIASGETVI